MPVGAADSVGAAGCVVSPAGEVVTAEMASWLQRTVRAQVLTPGYEAELARRMGPDLFGLLRLPSPPRFLVTSTCRTLLPEHIAPLLRRICLTQPAPAPPDLHPAALATDPGPVTTTTRTPAQRRWAQPPGTPLLPAQITIPHLIHGIWLGTPLNPASNYAANFAAIARHPPATPTSPSGPTSPAPPSPPPTPRPRPPTASPTPTPHTATCSPGPASHGIHLINVHEIFHAAQPMTLHAQYTAETNKQLPRGYAGATDHLRLDIIHLLGGIYTDGDNHLTPHATPAAPHHPPRRRHRLRPRLHPPPPPRPQHQQRRHHRPRPPPRHHPLARTHPHQLHPHPSRTLRRRQKMARHYAELPADQLWHRYTTRARAGQVRIHVLQRLGLAPDDARLVRVAPVITPGSQAPASQRSRARATTPPLVPLTAGQVTSRLTRAITTLARQLTSREGNLHLTAIAPLITTLPDPDAAWTATLTLLADLTTTGATPPVTSITTFRWTDDGTPHTITLPPEAHALIDHTPHHHPWLGHTLAAPGHPAWLLDEAITPARLHPRPKPTPLAPLRALTQTLTRPPRQPRRHPHPRTPRHHPRPRTPRTPRLRHHPARRPLRPAHRRPPPHHPRPPRPPPPRTRPRRPPPPPHHPPPHPPHPPPHRPAPHQPPPPTHPHRASTVPTE